MLRTLVWRPKASKAKVVVPAPADILSDLHLLDERAHVLEDPARISDCMADGRACVWVDLTDPTPEELAMVQEEFGLHPLAVEDAARQAQRPKIEAYEGTYFMVVFAIELNADMVKVGSVFDDQDDSVAPAYRLGWLAGTPFHLHEVDLFIGKNFLVTSHAVPLPVIDRTWNRWLANPVSSEEGIGSVTYRVLDAMVDEYFPVLDGIVEEVEELEQRLFNMAHRGAKNEDLRALFRIKRDLLQLRRVLGPERDAVLVLSRGDMQLFDRKVGFYFQDVYDHIARLTDSLDVYQDMLTNALESYLSLVSNNLNEVMKTLTSVTVMFMAPTLIAGIYGMNFQYMPELEWAYGYPFALALMLGSVVGTFIFFRRREWI
jgi:magnesium transporter